MVLTVFKMTTFLGVYIDTKCTWTYHINNVTTRLSRIVGVMCRVSHILGSNGLLTLYYTLLLTIIRYVVRFGNYIHHQCTLHYNLKEGD